MCVCAWGRGSSGCWALSPRPRLLGWLLDVYSLIPNVQIYLHSAWPDGIGMSGQVAATVHFGYPRKSTNLPPF